MADSYHYNHFKITFGANIILHDVMMTALEKLSQSIHVLMEREHPGDDSTLNRVVYVRTPHGQHSLLNMLCDNLPTGFGEIEVSVATYL